MNTIKKIEMLFTWLIIASLFGGCAPAPDTTTTARVMVDGMIDGLQPGTTLWVIERASSMMSGTIRMAKDNYVLLAAWMENSKAWGYVFLDASQSHPIDYLALSCGGTGNCANPRTMSEVVTSLLNRGWRVIEVVPAGITAALAESRSWLRVMPNIPVLIIPGVFFDVPGQILPSAGEIE